MLLCKCKTILFISQYQNFTMSTSQKQIINWRKYILHNSSQSVSFYQEDVVVILTLMSVQNDKKKNNHELNSNRITWSKMKRTKKNSISFVSFFFVTVSMLSCHRSHTYQITYQSWHISVDLWCACDWEDRRRDLCLTIRNLIHQDRDI